MAPRQASGPPARVNFSQRNIRMLVVDTATKVCTMCGEERPIASFRSRGGSQAHLYKSRCNSCLYKEHRRWTEENPDRVREYREKDSWTLAKRCSRRGITPEQLVDAFERQECCCAICHDSISLMGSAIDHNHETGEFRGVLCRQCNRALGMFRDSPVILQSALNYLKDMGSYGDSGYAD